MKSIVAILPVLALAASAEPLHPQHLAYRSFQREFAETTAFAERGIKLRAFGVCNTENALGDPYSDYPNVWKASGVYDFAVFDSMVDELLAASPVAEFLCLIDLNTPRWLQRKLNLDSFEAISHAAADPRWREETQRYLRALLDHTESKCGDRIRAYSLMAGLTTEWFEFRCPYSSTIKNAAWRAWCAKNGIAGGETTPSLESMARGAFEGVLFDPVTESEKIAYWRFHNETVADALLGCAKVVREKVGDTKEIGAFFGYYFICNKRLGSICHLDYERVIASPDLDFFSSPATYTDRACGFGTSSMAVTGTLRRHGKRVLHEIDFWPDYRNPPWKFKHYWTTPGETIAGNTREAAYALVNGLSSWWFDMWGDMYNTPGMKDRIARLAEIHARFAGKLPPPDADLLIVADPESAYAMADPEAKCPDGFIPSLGCGEQLVRTASRLGITYDTCSFNDLPHLDLSKVKLVCLPATWVITPEKEKILRETVCRDGRTVLWTYAPGVSDGKTLDMRRIAVWAGTPFKTPEITTTSQDGWRAVYAYDWRKLTAERLREIADAAGCFGVTDELLPVASNGRLLAIHCKDGGAKTVHLRHGCREVIELISNRVVATDTDSFIYTFASPDTAIFELR